MLLGATLYVDHHNLGLRKSGLLTLSLRNIVFKFNVDSKQN